MERELELKFYLPDAEAAAALEDAARGRRRDRVVQINHLFDTPDARLRAAGLTLRLREEAGSWQVTLKGPSRRLGAARDREELDAAVGRATADRILAGGVSPLDALDASAALVAEARERAAGGLRYLGDFRNVRVRVDADLPGYGPALLEIDRTHLPGGRVDHEVELEVPATGPDAVDGAGRAESALRSLLERIGVEPVPASGKAGRFVRALGLADG